MKKGSRARRVVEKSEPQHPKLSPTFFYKLTESARKYRLVAWRLSVCLRRNRTLAVRLI